MPEREPRWRDADRMDLRIEQGRLRRRHVRALAREIARIHGESPKAPESSAAASPGGIARRLHNDLEALSEQGVLPSRMSDALHERKYEALTDGPSGSGSEAAGCGSRLPLKTPGGMSVKTSHP